MYFYAGNSETGSFCHARGLSRDGSRLGIVSRRGEDWRRTCPTPAALGDSLSARLCSHGWRNALSTQTPASSLAAPPPGFCHLDVDGRYPWQYFFRGRALRAGQCTHGDVVYGPHLHGSLYRAGERGSARLAPDYQTGYWPAGRVNCAAWSPAISAGTGPFLRRWSGAGRRAGRAGLIGDLRPGHSRGQAWEPGDARRGAHNLAAFLQWRVPARDEPDF